MSSEMARDPAGEILRRAFAWFLLVAVAVGQDGEDPAASETAAALKRADQLDLQSEDFLAAGKYPEAAAAARESLTLREGALGPHHLEVACSLTDLGRVLYMQGQYEAALPLHRRALAIREKRLGDHPDVAKSLNNVALALQGSGEYEEALPLFERAVAILEKSLGAEHRDVALVLANVAGLLRDQGQYDAARLHYERVLAIDEKALGALHPDVAVDLINLGAVLLDMDRLAAAAPILERAQDIAVKSLGPDHLVVAASLDCLGTYHSLRGDFGAARPCLERALAIRERVLGPDHPDVASNLGGLAALLYDQGRYEAARSLMERALAIREKVLGPDHPDVAKALCNLAAVLCDLREVEAARSLYERAVAIAEASLGPDHPIVAKCLDGLAGLLADQGQWSAARSLLERSLAISEKALGADHSDTARTLCTLGEALRAQGQSAEACRLYERSIAILEKKLGPDHPAVAAALGNLATVLAGQGKDDSARLCCERALSIFEKALGPDHPDVAGCLTQLAALLEKRGRPEDVLALYQRALAVRERALGADHPDVARSLGALAIWFYRQRDYEEAMPLLYRVLEIAGNNLRRAFLGLQGAERLALLSSARHHLDAWLLLAPHVGRSGYTEALRFKGLVARIEAADRTALRCGDETIRKTRDEVLALDRRLGALVANFPRDMDTREAWRRTYAGLAAKREALLLNVTQQCAPVRQDLDRLDLSVEDVQSRLGEGDVLLDLLSVANSLYVAWVVTPTGEPVRVKLGAAQAIGTASEEFLRSMTGGDSGRGLSQESGSSDKDAGARLGALVLTPLMSHLPKGTRRLYICPDAALAAVPFAALPGSEPGAFLIDEFEIVHLEAAQDLVSRTGTHGKGALILGGIDYGHAKEQVSPPLNQRVDRAPRDDRTWVALPGTAHEAALVARWFGEDAATLSGDEATEGRFRALATGKAVLHIATHGYSREDRLAGLRRREEDQRRLDPLLEKQVATGYDPLLLSGVVLAGANAGDGGGGDDGLLTAAEVSWLDLRGVNLVVLSACDTGRGTVASGEGTLGLVRGFRLAGAEAVLASLWRVDDAATEKLMGSFYRGLLGEKLSPARALREAAIALRDFKDGEGRQRYSAPRYWAAFIAYGP